jgi:hypothetical protein
MLAARRVVGRSGSVSGFGRLFASPMAGFLSLPSFRPGRRARATAGVAVVMALLGLAASLCAQVTPAPAWSQQTPATSPPARAFAAMAYDAGTNQVVLFGGQGSSGNLNDTWTWNGTTWTQMSPATSPPARDVAAMAYDANSGQVVLFGGLKNSGGSGNLLNDTWTWNGSTWIQQTPATSPEARFSATMAYDASSGQVVLFGGEAFTANGVDFVGDTWTWNGTTWTQQTPAMSPPARGYAVMAYDATSGQELLFGGESNGTGFPFLNDTWTWNGTTWTQLSPATSPPLTGQAVMAYDANSGQELLFGGVNSGGTNVLGDTWTWDGTTWTQQTPVTSPEVRFSAAMAYDASSGQVVLFGGEGTSSILGDTWALQQGPVNLGSVNVCTAGATTPSPCSQTATLAFDVVAGTTISSINVLTQGAPNLDFKAAATQESNACAMQTYTSATTCTVTVTFAPKHPGQRLGAVVLQDSAGDPPATTYVSGTGQGPQITFSSPGMQSMLGSGFSSPIGVAVDGSGNVFVADFDSGVKEIVAVNGVVSSSSMVNPVGSGFSSPQGVSVDGSGNVFVADTNHNAVKEIVAVNGVVSSSSTVNTLGSGFSLPEGVAVDGSGNVFVADLLAGVKEILAVNGSIPATNPTINPLGSGFAQPSGVAVDGSGNVFVAEGNAVEEILAGTGGAASGTVNGSSMVNPLGSGFTQPQGVAVDGSGNVFVADSNAVKEILAVNGVVSSSSMINTLGSGFSGPRSVAVDGSGNVFVADQGNSRIEKLDYADPPTLTFATTNDGTTDGAQSVTITNDGNEPLTAISAGLSVAANFTQVDGTGTPANCTASFVLAEDASCNLSIEFAPVAPANGTVNGAVTLTDNNLNATPSTMQMIPLVGTAVEVTPTVTGISPTSGPTAGGTVVTITGTNFTGATSVRFGGAAATSLTVISATSITTTTSPAGTGTVDVVVTNPSGSSATSAADRFTYIQPVTLSSATLPAATAETAYGQTLTASGGTAPYTYAVTGGALPAGLTLSSAGVISGTPTAAGSFNVTVTATDSNGSKVMAAYSLAVTAPTITLSPATLTAATAETAYSQTLTASGGTGTYTYSVTAGALPAGVALSSVGVISGTPTTSGSFSFTVTAKDGDGFTGIKAYTLSVSAPTITISPTTLPAAMVGTAYSATLTASGGTAPYTDAISAGALPAGITLSAGGVLAGTATASGSFHFTVMATAGGFAGNQAYTLTVNAATVNPPTITISPMTLAAATAGTAYSATLMASGGAVPYRYSVTSGALPSGITLSASGVLAGTPAASGSFNFTVMATDSSAAPGPYSGTASYTLLVNIAAAPLGFTFTNAGTAAYTAAPGAMATYSFALAPLSGSYPGAVSFSVTGLPAGATASFTPSTVAVGSGATPVVMTVQTASATAQNKSNSPFGRGIVLAFLLLPFVAKRSVREKLKGRMLLLVLLMAGVTATLTGCGSTNGFMLQSPQTYTLTVTVTSGTFAHSQAVTLIVQ